MGATGLERLLRRDRAIVSASLGALVVLCWIYLLWTASAMAGHGMDSAASSGGAMAMGPGHAHGLDPPDRLGAGLAEWGAAEFAVMSLMWVVMMVGMMTPSAAPMILIYARVARQASDRGKALAPAGWFALGYLAAWSGFALAATVLQWLLERSLLLSPMMAAASSWLGSLILIAAGAYQWTPLKDSCLGNCRSPLLFIQRHGGFRGDPWGGLRLGLQHGLYCIGCCWALMLLLFVGGVMNLLWIAAIAMLVLAEKLVPRGRLLSRLAGLGLIAAGLAMAGASV